MVDADFRPRQTENERLGRFLFWARRRKAMKAEENAPLNAPAYLTPSHAFVNAMMQVLKVLPTGDIEVMVSELVALRQREGRLFCIGIGGGAANASHAVNDFRKLCDIETYSPGDNIAELTARSNDDGWATIFDSWLHTSHLNNKDALFIFSVGGGTGQVSSNIVNAVDLAKKCGAKVFGIVGPRGGETAKQGDVVIKVTTSDKYQTPITEAMQLVVLHALVSNPRLQVRATTW